MLAQIMAFIGAVPPDSRGRDLSDGERVHIIHDFTDDLEGLRSRLLKGAVEAPRRTQGIDSSSPSSRSGGRRDDRTMEASTSWVSGGSRLEEQSNQHALTRRHEFTMASLEAVGNHLAAIPGRKNLIWMTSGVPMMSVGTRDAWPENYETALRRVAQRLASQGISMYPVEPAGIRPPYLNVNAAAKGSTRGVEDSVAGAAASDAIGRAAARVEARAAARGQPLALQTMIAGPNADLRSIASASDLFADLTGGRAVRNTNDLLAGIKAASEDMRGTYSIGFYVPQESDERWHTFAVRVTRPHMKVVHRQGYLSSAATKHSELWLADQWRAADGNPLARQVSASTRGSSSRQHALFDRPDPWRRPALRDVKVCRPASSRWPLRSVQRRDCSASATSRGRLRSRRVKPGTSAT